MALPHVEAGEIANLAPLGEGLREAATHALVKTDRFEAIRLVVPAGAIIPEHAVEGPITLHCLEGKVTLERNGAELAMQEGDWVHLTAGEPHSLRGLQNASLLLTIIF